MLMQCYVTNMLLCCGNILTYLLTYSCDIAAELQNMGSKRLVSQRKARLRIIVMYIVSAHSLEDGFIQEYITVWSTRRVITGIRGPVIDGKIYININMACETIY